MNVANGPIRVGLIGMGAIGMGVVDLLRGQSDDEKQIELVAALVRDPERSRPDGVPETVTSVTELLARKPDIVVEVAGHEALRTHGAAVLRAGYDLIAVSVGALADPALHDELRAAAEEGGGQVRIASGAIGGLDAISSAAVGGIRKVTHTTRKNPRTLLGEEGAKITEVTELYHGPAREGVLMFPESINVAAAVSLAGIGLDRTEVRVLADPGVQRNLHEVVVEGEFGALRFEIESIPSDANPKTGRIVAMSIIRALQQRRNPIAFA